MLIPTKIPAGVKSVVWGRERPQDLNKDEVVYAWGEAASSAYVVLTGQILLSRKSDSGREVGYGLVQQNYTFGEEVMHDGGRRRHNASAYQRSCIKKISLNDNWDKIREDAWDRCMKLENLWGVSREERIRLVQQWYSLHPRSRGGGNALKTQARIIAILTAQSRENVSSYLQNAR